MHETPEIPNKDSLLETKHRNKVQVALMEMIGIDTKDNEAMAKWIKENSLEVKVIIEESDNENIRELARTGKYKEAALLVSGLMGKGIRFNLDEYFYKHNNIPEERQFKEGSRVVYGIGLDGEKLTGVIKTFVGKEAGFKEKMAGIEVDNEQLKRLGRRAVPVKELIELNPEGAIDSGATKEEADKFKGYPKAA